MSRRATVCLPLLAVLIGAVYSGLLAKLGFIALLDGLDVGMGGPMLKGSTPAFHVGTPWGFTLDRMPDLSGQSFVVTGANVGLGYWTAYHMAASNASLVVLACRSMQKCNAAVAAIRNGTGRQDSGRIVAMELDLSSFASILGFVARFGSAHRTLDGLILNAGVMMCPFGLTHDNLEMQIGTNHFGHHLLTVELLPQLENAVLVHGVATVVSLSSSAHYSSYPEGILDSVEAMSDRTRYDRVQAYGQSKLANVLFAQELSERWRSKGVLANSLHPGVVDTELFRHIDETLEIYLGTTLAWIVNTFVHPRVYGGLWLPQDAALTQLYAAVSPQVRGDKISGKYFHPIARENAPGLHARNQTLQRQLWDITETFINDWKRKHA